MPLLAAWIGSLFGAIATWLVKFVTQRVVIKGVYIATVVALTVALMAAFNGWIAPLVGQLFATQYGQFIGLAFPPISGPITTSYFTAILAVQLYKLRMRAAAVAASA